MSLLSPSFAFFPDGLRINALLDHHHHHPCFGLHHRPVLLSSAPSSSSSSPLLFNSSNGSSFGYGGASPLGLLCMSTGLAHPQQQQQPSSEMTISGRALSLLSSTSASTASTGANSIAPRMELPPVPCISGLAAAPIASLPSASHLPLQLADEQNPILQHLPHHHRARMTPASANYALGIGAGDHHLMQPPNSNAAFHGFLASSQEHIISNNPNSLESEAHCGAMQSKFEGQSMFSAMNHNNNSSSSSSSSSSNNINNINNINNNSNHNGGGHGQVVLELMQGSPSPSASSPSPSLSPSSSSLTAVEAQHLVQVQDMVPYSADVQGLSIFGRQRGIM